MMALEDNKMNKEWSDLCTLKQEQLKKKETFQEGIHNLLLLRSNLLKQMEQFRNEITNEEFAEMPYINAKGYENKTVAYSLYHVFRIEDIVSNTLIRKDEEVFFTKNYQERMNASIITTGNELVREQIGEFSAQLNIDELYNYIREVDESTTKLIQSFRVEDMKIKMTEDDKKNVRMLHVVSEDPCADWLVNYWCSKNILGLIQTPLSRHWLMHVKPCIKMIEKIKKTR